MRRHGTVAGGLVPGAFVAHRFVAGRSGIGVSVPAEATPDPASPEAQAACPEVPEPTGTPCFEVSMHDFAFDPASITVPTVARIVFTNGDSASHSIKWADGTPTSPTLAKGASTERELIRVPAGTISYVCGIHGASMSGEIVVDDTLPIP